ncbi:hypothetical protein NBH15_17505 [Parabacteroides sp. W1-Q-101]|nr:MULTISPECIES: hypothetical protein [Parabacteroides]MCM0720068.1 hypothetical protein [Parabacteroides sp. W1-Q-101]
MEYYHFAVKMSFCYLSVFCVSSCSSGVGSAGVKAVLDRLNVVLVRHLQHGRRVSVGELGTFRYTIGSPGVIDEKTFDTNLIREPKVRFYPGKALRGLSRARLVLRSWSRRKTKRRKKRMAEAAIDRRSNN